MLTKVYLDMIWHRPDRTVIGREEFDRQLDKLVMEDEWIIDFPRDVVPEIEHHLKNFDKIIIRFHSRTEVDNFIETFQSQ